jgi:hypothetical protein
MRSRYVLTFLLLASLGRLCSGGNPPLPLPAPAGKCWNYSPSYCYLKALDCSVQELDEDLEHCIVAGAECGGARKTDQNTNQELIADAAATEGAGFLTWTIGGTPTEVICGHNVICRYVSAGIGENGVRRVRCEEPANPGGETWKHEMPRLSGNCPPPPPPPTPPGPGLIAEVTGN